MFGRYVLDGRVPVRCDDYEAWARWYCTADRHVGKTDVDGVVISTVFLGNDHAFYGGPPVLFETMIFGGPLDQEQWRYCTWEKAEAGHETAVSRVRFEAGYNSPTPPPTEP